MGFNGISWILRDSQGILMGHDRHDVQVKTLRSLPRPEAPGALRQPHLSAEQRQSRRDPAEYGAHAQPQPAAEGGVRVGTGGCGGSG